MSLLDLHLHDRAFPGPLGFTAFVGVKFGGYIVAGFALRKRCPSIVAAPAKIAALRTGLGILLGPAFLIGLAGLTAYIGWTSDSDWLPYIVLLCIRVLIWALVIWIFLRRTAEARRYFWVNAGAGALWSALLDVSAILLLAIAPGRIPIC
jgi:hypothetical protein